MALVAFLRGVNVGGHRRFRPTLIASQLRDYDVVNVGATGILVARNARSRSALQSAVLRALPFETDVVICDGRELIGCLGRIDAALGARVTTRKWSTILSVVRVLA